MSQVIEAIKAVGSVASCILGCVSVVALIAKPIRKKVVDFIARTSKQSQFETALAEATATMAKMSADMKDSVDALRDEMNTKFDTIQQENQAQTVRLGELQVAMDNEREASKASLGNTIKHIYFKYQDERKLPVREVEALCLLHKAYKLENGNSFVDALFEEMMDEWKHVG